MTDRHGHELHVGNEVPYFPDPFTECHVTVLRVEADGNYLVQRVAAVPVRRLPPDARRIPTERVPLEDVLTGAVPMPVSAWEDVTDHGVPEELFIVSGRGLTKPVNWLQ